MLKDPLKGWDSVKSEHFLIYSVDSKERDSVTRGGDAGHTAIGSAYHCMLGKAILGKNQHCFSIGVIWNL